jgi:hypothetical protein
MDPYSALNAYNETLARRIVADVARVTSERPMGWVMLHEVARHLKVDEASAEAAMRIAIGRGWLNSQGSSLYQVCLTDAGRALPLPQWP